MPLTDIKVKTAKLPDGKAECKLSDEKGLYLLIRKAGKYWRLKYRFGGKEKTLALGIYPTVSLKEARKSRDRAKEQLANNIDPNESKKAAKRESEKQTMSKTFNDVADEWYDLKLPNWADSTACHNESRLRNYIKPRIGKVTIKDIEPMDVLAIARIAEHKGFVELAHRIVRLCGQIMRYGVACGYVTSDCTRDLKGALPPVNTKHHPCLIEPKKIGELMRRIQEYNGTFIVQCALKITPYLFLRPGELRRMEWSWIDFERSLIKLPSEIMKMRKPHAVHLAPQARDILLELQKLTGEECFVFTGQGRAKYISDGTINKCLRKMGYDTQTEQDAHGFRGLAATQLYEQGVNPQYIELQQAHSYGSSSSLPYNHSTMLSERARMLDDWANYLDALRDGAHVIPIRRNA